MLEQRPVLKMIKKKLNLFSILFLNYGDSYNRYKHKGGKKDT